MSEHPQPENSELSETEQRSLVQDRYTKIAAESSCCDTSGDADEIGCEATEGTSVEKHAEQLGYERDQLEAAPEGANLGLGCGNPNAIAGLEEGEVVLDLGSGGGFDCFLASREVGDSGTVIGVDMSPEMVENARTNAETNEVENVEFRLGEIEHLPVADEQVDVIISNCVINLSPDKSSVFQDAYRVLRPGGRLAISDVVLTATLPEEVRNDPEYISRCVAGASPIGTLERLLDEKGFADVSIEPKEDSETFIREWDDERDLTEYIASANIQATKPSS